MERFPRFENESEKVRFERILTTIRQQRQNKRFEAAIELCAKAIQEFGQDPRFKDKLEAEVQEIITLPSLQFGKYNQIFDDYIINSDRLLSATMINQSFKLASDAFIKNDYVLVIELIQPYIGKFKNNRLANYFLGAALCNSYNSNDRNDGEVILKELAQIDLDMEKNLAEKDLVSNDAYFDARKIVSYAMQQLGILYNRKEQYLFAFYYLRKSYELNPTEPTFASNLARLLYHAGISNQTTLDKWETEYAELEKINDNNSKFNEALTIISEINNYLLAHKYGKNTLELFKNHYENFQLIASILKELRDFEHLKDHLELMINLARQCNRLDWVKEIEREQRDIHK